MCNIWWLFSYFTIYFIYFLYILSAEIILTLISQMLFAPYIKICKWLSYLQELLPPPPLSRVYKLVFPDLPILAVGILCAMLQGATFPSLAILFSEALGVGINNISIKFQFILVFLYLVPIYIMKLCTLSKIYHSFYFHCHPLWWSKYICQCKGSHTL